MNPRVFNRIIENPGAYVPDAEYWDEIAKDAVKQGAHVAASWEFVQEDGADGCMPAGWYAIGLDARGLPITWPVRHEYGPFATEQEARAHVMSLQQ